MDIISEIPIAIDPLEIISADRAHRSIDRTSIPDRGENLPHRGHTREFMNHDRFFEWSRVRIWRSELARRLSAGSRRRRAVACALESLEQRTLLTQWIGGTGNWNTAADWSGGVVPGANDDVVIPAGSNVTISDQEGANTITTAAGSTVTLETGQLLEVDGGGTFNGTFNWNGTIEGNSNVLTFAGTTVVAGSTDGGSVANTGDMTFEGGGFSSSPVTNSGTVTVTGGILLDGNSSFTNSAGGTFTITDNSGFVPATGGSGGTFINEGTFTKSGGNGNSLFYPTAGSGDFENIQGTVNIDSGNFTIETTAALQGGQVNVASGSTLTFLCEEPAVAFNVTLAGTLTGSGGGTISLAAGNFYPQAPGEVAADATLNFPRGMVQVGDVTFESDSNTLTNTGFLDFASSTGNGTISMINQGTVTNSGSSNLPLWVFVNDATGILDLQTDAGLSVGDGNATGLTNMGVIRKSGGTGVSVLTTNFFNDGGSLDIESGSLAFQEGSFGYIAGPITIAAGSALDFETSNAVCVQGTLSSTGGGTVTMSSGWFDGPNSNLGENSRRHRRARLCPRHADVRRGVHRGQRLREVRQRRHHQFCRQRRPTGIYVQLRHDQFCRRAI